MENKTSWDTAIADNTELRPIPHPDWRERFFNKYEKLFGREYMVEWSNLIADIAEVEKLAEYRATQAERKVWFEAEKNIRQALKDSLVEAGEKKRKKPRLFYNDIKTNGYNQAISDYQDIIKSA